MKTRAFALGKLFILPVCAILAALGFGMLTNASAAPVVFSVSTTSTRAVALESVSMRAEPFSLSSEGNFSPADPRTRITLFCMNLDLLVGEPANTLEVDAEDASHTIYPLNVEYV